MDDPDCLFYYIDKCNTTTAAKGLFKSERITDFAVLGYIKSLLFFLF
jgi:hypothetical protein